MTDEQIEAMIKDQLYQGGYYFAVEDLIAFARMVEATTREGAAKMCEQQSDWEDDVACDVCAAAIRRMK